MRGSRLAIEVKEFIEKLDDRGVSHQYLIGVRSALNRFRVFCEIREIGCAKRVELGLVREFLDTISANSASNQRFVLQTLRRFLAFHGNICLVDYRPRINGSSRTRVDWLSEAESHQIFETSMTPQESVLIGAGLLEGLRRCETIRITAGETRQALRSSVLSVRGKTGPRSIPLHEDFRVLLERYLATTNLRDDELLLGIRSNSTSRKILLRFCARYGKRFGFHTLRRSFGRNLWLLGTPIETISELYGHASVDMTRMYLGVGISDMSKALAGYRFGIAKLSVPEPKTDST